MNKTIYSIRTKERLFHKSSKTWCEGVAANNTAHPFGGALFDLKKKVLRTFIVSNYKKKKNEMRAGQTGFEERSRNS